MDRRIGRIVVTLVCISFVAAFQSSCARKGPAKVDSGHQIVMGTFARVVVIAKDDKTGSECVRAALEKIHKVDELMSDYKRDSEIGRVNKMAVKHKKG